MITMPNQIDFIPVVNIIPQPIYPAIYLPGIVHPFIQYNFVNYPQCGNFPNYNENYDQNPPQPQSLPPGLTSPEDDVFYFHDFFFSKDDPLLESYGDTVSATETFENMTKTPEKSITLSSLALSIMNSIWSDSKHNDAWEGFSIYKSGSIHHSQWRSILIETTQEQTNLISSEQMSKVIKKLLESSSQQSRFQKYCRNNSVHTILENYEEYQLWREIESILMEDQNELPFNIENVELGQVEIAEGENYQRQEQFVSSEEQILIETDDKNSLLSEKIQAEPSITIINVKREKASCVVEEENAICKVTKECFTQVEHLANTKENNKNGINRFRKSKRNTRKIKEIKNYAEIESSDSDQINKHKEKKEIEEDQTRLKLQNPKEFEEDQGVLIENNVNEENPQILETVENVKTKKARKNHRRKKANKNVTANKFQSEDHPPANVPDNILVASNIPNDSLSAHIEKLLALTLNQENENDFRYNMKGKMEDNLKDEEEKEFIAMKDYNTDFSKDFIKQTQNSTLTGETSAKTETDISTEYEECKKDGSTQKASKQNQQFNRTLKEDYEEQNMRQTDLIQSPKSASNIENEYYMDMISNILSEDPGALERLKEMLLSHSANLGLPGVGFTEEELQEIEEVNMELEKVMKRRFKDNQAEEDENPFLQQEEKPRYRPYGPEHDLIGLSNELVSLSALLCDDFDDIGPQKNLEIESNALGIPFETISYLEELMRNRAEFLGELQSGTKNA